MLFKFLVSCCTFFFNFCRLKVQRFLPFSCDWNCFQWLTSFASLFADLVQRCLQLFLQLLTSNSIDNSAPVIIHNLLTIKINRNCFKGFNLANSLRSIVLNLLVFCVNHDMDLLKEFRSFNQVEMRKFLWRFDKLTHAFGLPQNFAPPSINYRLSIQNHFLIKTRWFYTLLIREDYLSLYLFLSYLHYISTNTLSPCTLNSFHSIVFLSHARKHIHFHPCLSRPVVRRSRKPPPFPFAVRI